MEGLCKNLSIFSGGQYVPSLRNTRLGYLIHNQNHLPKEHFPGEHIPIFSRNCQLRKVDNTETEIVITAPMFDSKNSTFNDGVIILGCVNSMCKMEAVAVLFKGRNVFERQANVDGTFCTKDYMEDIIYRFPGMLFNRSIAEGTDTISYLCNNVKSNSIGNYVDSGSAVSQTFDFRTEYVTLRMNHPYTEVIVRARRCPLEMLNNPQIDIRLTTPAIPVLNRSKLEVLHVSVLECNRESVCKHQMDRIFLPIQSNVENTPQTAVLETSAPPSLPTTNTKRRYSEHGESSSHDIASTDANKRSRTADSQQRAPTPALYPSPVQVSTSSHQIHSSSSRSGAYTPTASSTSSYSAGTAHPSPRQSTRIRHPAINPIPTSGSGTTTSTSQHTPTHRSATPSSLASLQLPSRQNTNAAYPMLLAVSRSDPSTPISHRRLISDAEQETRHSSTPTSLAGSQHPSPRQGAGVPYSSYVNDLNLPDSFNVSSAYRYKQNASTSTPTIPQMRSTEIPTENTTYWRDMMNLISEMQVSDAGGSAAAPNEYRAPTPLDDVAHDTWMTSDLQPTSRPAQPQPTTSSAQTRSKGQQPYSGTFNMGPGNNDAD